MSAVFADTFYFIALVNRNDKAHSKCVEFSRQSDRPVVTTSWVLMELGDALRRGRDRAAFSLLYADLVADPDTSILPADQTTFEKALALFAARPDKGWSLTDCTSFAVMQDLAVSEALTGDHHFEQAGFVALLRAGG